jgi:hypothetical protein
VTLVPAHDIDVFVSEVDIGLPHVHRDCPNTCELLRGAGLIECGQTHLLPALRDKLDGPAIDVVDDGQVSMAFAERLLIDADAGNRGGLLVGEAAGHGSLEDVPGLLPGDADKRLELPVVNVPPLALGSMVVPGQLTATLRAVPGVPATSPNRTLSTVC